MKKHVLSFNESYQSQIGKGSVLLIKGKPETDGRRLYATIISGFAEIKPGVIMAFLGDEIYRVIHKGGGDMAGRRVDIRSEEALKGVLNLRNPGVPSIVLNHNKTPFHWSTLKHTQIGPAIRELGTRLFSHDLLLESDQDQSLSPINLKIFKEAMKAIAGTDSLLMIKDVDCSGFTISEDPPEDSGSDTEQWELIISMSPDREKPGSLEFIEELESAGIIAGLDDALSDFLEVEDTLECYMMIESTAEWHIDYDSGDYFTPPSYEADLNWIENDIEDLYINEEEVIKDILDDEAKELYMAVRKAISDLDKSGFDKLVKK